MMYKEKIVGEVAYVLDTAGKILAEHFKPENKSDVAAVILAGKLAEVSADWFDPFGRRSNVVALILDKLYEEVPEGGRIPAESIIRDLILSHLHAQQAQQATAVDAVIDNWASTFPREEDNQ